MPNTIINLLRALVHIPSVHSDISRDDAQNLLCDTLANTLATLDAWVPDGAAVLD